MRQCPPRLGLVTDLHPNDRGPKGVFSGAVIANGNLYCPATPKALLALGPLAPNASGAEAIAHDAKTAERARYKLGESARLTPTAITVSPVRRVGKAALPAAGRLHGFVPGPPEIFVPPPSPPTCCVQASITVPPSVNAKTTPKHDYPSAAHRRSYGRRTAVERAYASLKDRATTNIDRGWCG